MAASTSGCRWNLPVIRAAARSSAVRTFRSGSVLPIGPHWVNGLACASRSFCIGSEGRYAQAGALFGQVLNIQRRVLGPEHPYTLHSMYHLANIYREQGKYAQSEALLGQAFQISRRVFGPEDVHTLDCMDRLAEV